MFRLQELVRLHRMGTSCHEVARLLGMSPNTERSYRGALKAAELLAGPSDALPQEAELLAAVKEQLGEGCRPPQLSSVDAWSGDIGTRPTGALGGPAADRLDAGRKTGVSPGLLPRPAASVALVRWSR